MATEAVVYFDTKLPASALSRVPERLLSECPAFPHFCQRWGWPADSTRYEWRPVHPRIDGEQAVLNQWSRGYPVTLFGPGGHLKFGPAWLEWSTETKWSWLFDGRAERAALIEAAGQLASLVRTDVALVTGDWGADDDVLDVLEAGGTVGDAITTVSKGGELMPLQSVPVVEGDSANRPNLGAYFLLRFK